LSNARHYPELYEVCAHDLSFAKISYFDVGQISLLGSVMRGRAAAHGPRDKSMVPLIWLVAI
jgi:hypothetical protein